MSTAKTKGVSNRQIRSAVNKQGAVLEESVMPTLQQCMVAIGGLADNQRALANAFNALKVEDAARRQNLWTRLRYLVMGR